MCAIKLNYLTLHTGKGKAEAAEVAVAAASAAVVVATAFDAGRAAFLKAGYREGDPDDYLHLPTHEHCTAASRPAGWKKCPGCNPPVHGEPVLVAKRRPDGAGVATPPVSIG